MSEYIPKPPEGERLPDIQMMLICLSLALVLVVVVITVIGVKKVEQEKWHYVNTPSDLNAGLRSCNEYATVKKLEKGWEYKCNERH